MVKLLRLHIGIQFTKSLDSLEGSLHADRIARENNIKYFSVRKWIGWTSCFNILNNQLVSQYNGEHKFERI